MLRSGYNVAGSEKMKSPFDRILIAIQFWKGDQGSAMDLARLLADNESKHSDRADILFIRRFDCKEDTASVAHVSRKFNFHSWKSRRQGTGWPAGCNDLWFSAIEWFYHMKKDRKIPNYKAMFTIEGDGCPVKKDWIERMHAQWDKHSAGGAKIVGHWQQHPDPHINGNLLVSGDLVYLDWLSKAIHHVPARCGWDWWLADDFEKRGWADTPGIENFYNVPTMAWPWFQMIATDPDMFYVHGVKDASVRNHFRRFYI